MRYPRITASMASSTGVMIGMFLLQRVVATAALDVTIAAICIGHTFMMFSPFSGVLVVG